MAVEAKVVQDSISPNGIRLVTLQLKYYRFIHSEVMTHRVFSRNASSSRAIPVSKMLSQVWNDPATPLHFGSNQSGMQAKAELTGWKRWAAEKVWRIAGKAACCFAWAGMKLGLHKQVANRILEPWQWIHVVLTSTEWSNFFELRDHSDAQPEIQALAKAVRKAMHESCPKALTPGQWHLPYVTQNDWNNLRATCSSVEEIVAKALSISAARCCRVSYLKHDGTTSSIDEDLTLCDRLAGSRPIHASPFEHQGTPDKPKYVAGGTTQVGWAHPELHGNFKGWIQHRKMLEQSFK